MSTAKIAVRVYHSVTVDYYKNHALTRQSNLFIDLTKDSVEIKLQDIEAECFVKGYDKAVVCHYVKGEGVTGKQLAEIVEVYPPVRKAPVRIPYEPSILTNPSYECTTVCPVALV